MFLLTQFVTHCNTSIKHCRAYALSLLVAVSIQGAQAQTAYDSAGPDETPTPDAWLESSGGALTLDEVQVTGSLSTLAPAKASRIVTVISADEIRALPVSCVTDILKLTSGVDVRQRGAMGVQSDISLDGGTYDQISILLNGVNITSPQTGHYSADWPVSIDDIERIEIIEGAASRYNGSSSLMGAINIVTRKTESNSLTLRARGGSYGTFGAEGVGKYTHSMLSHSLSGGYTRSDGGTTNSAFHRARVYYNGSLKGRLGSLELQAGYSDLDHGANTFYSGAYPNQHDHISRWIVSLSGSTDTKVKIEPMVYWQRLYDHFRLVHHSSFGENLHRTDVAGARLNASTNWTAGRTSLGGEVRRESIISTTLGRPLEPADYIPANDSVSYNHRDGRTSVSLSLEHLVKIGRVNISAGVIAAMNSGYDRRLRFYPGVDAAWNISGQWRLSGSWERSYRMPTFTDLYYKAPTHEGNRDLKPEQMSSWQLGVQFTGDWLSARLNGFVHDGRDMIDWVMYTPDDVFHATGFDLTNMGVGANLQIRFDALLGTKQPLQYLTAGYTYMHQQRHDAVEIYESRSALEYLRHKFTANLSHRLWRNASATWSLRWQHRMGDFLLYTDGKPQGKLVPYSPYATLDVKIEWQFLPSLSVNLSGSNLTNHRYYDCANIPQPGLWIMAGVTWRLL